MKIVYQFAAICQKFGSNHIQFFRNPLIEQVLKSLMDRSNQQEESIYVFTYTYSSNSLLYNHPKMTTYQKLSQLEHLKMRTAMYTGSIVSYEKHTPVWDGEKMVQKTVKTNDGLMKLFYEAIDNAVDNTLREPATKHIRVTMDSHTFKVENDGAHIPVKQQDGEYIPTFIFSKFLIENVL